MPDPALLDTSTIGESFATPASRKSAISHAAALSAKHQVMLTPIKHEDIETNMLNDAYLFGSQLGSALVDETSALVPPDMRQTLSNKHEKLSHSQSNRHGSSSGRQDKFKDHSPRHDMRASLEMEKNLLAAQGKLAYVSPTVRQSNNLNRHTFHGSTSQSNKQVTSAANLGFMTRQAGGSLSQLSPAQPGLQLGQPTVLLNTAQQVDLHRYSPLHLLSLTKISKR